MPSRKSVFILVCCVTFVLISLTNVYIMNIEKSIYKPVNFNKRHFSKHIVQYENNFWKKKDTRTIVAWTKYFDSWDWFSWMRNQMKTCPASCDLSNKRSELDSADAVLFHASDMWKYRGVVGTIYNYVKPMPDTRKPEQVWVLLFLEPISKLYGNVEHVFNWTITYRRDSLISSVYSTWRKKNITQLVSKRTQDVVENNFQNKTKFIATAISNCVDQAKRYKIIRELENYVKIDKFGRCYGERFRNFNFLGDYKFYIAIENNFCRDYITEKYWNTLNRKQIPVIATTKYNSELLPPGSFINVFDFDSIKSLADELIKIGNNETLYNSFFEWKRYYTPDNVGVVCKLCKELHKNRSAQSYVDTEDWIRDDMCQKSSTWSLISEYVEGWLFKLGLT
ncbi:alpha-(1,3)-fucosyltransferase C-like [Mercenaria mercenaria]|uniref:alpha-(1,3)-fucosyltransferase C-like n=1 Tax=Mercenaria mercenaria TaxID=6596 RepID=UPI00234E3FB2|nr:alpha-(1,3)-fucosyltransferase C-like [Mercenaria mercenaria]XP_045199432.2 alpha-(1,3)-fucosyltransferase C-like [Mercenaria mercenaria]